MVQTETQLIARSFTDVELDAVLCYVSGVAYFTTQPLEKQWGDDWNDAPYEHNAGTPYEWHEGRGEPEYQIIAIRWSGDFDVPSEWHYNSPWSVQDINKRATAWLSPARHNNNQHGIHIFAGTTLREFIDLMWQAGGTVYVPLANPYKDTPAARGGEQE